jgi:hypothetical protein
MAAPVSVCMIVKDEERSLGRCLDSVVGRVAEIIVVDTGSRDRTVEIARSYGARVLSFAWCDDFAAARNMGLEAASQPWILVLDADEALDEGEIVLPAADGGEVVVRNFAPADDPLLWHEFPLVRLFRRDARYRYQGAIHEQVRGAIVACGGTIAATDLRILHTGYADPVLANGELRALRNLALIRAQLALHGDDAYLWYQLGITEKAAGNLAAADAALARAQWVPQGRQIDADIAMKRAQLALARDDYDGCLAQAGVALRHDAAHALAMYCRAVALLHLGYVEEALIGLEAVLERGVLRPAVQGEVRRLVEVVGCGFASP